MAARPLHWCLKIANRPASIQFYRDLLEMTVLRHEEFNEGCTATCNGPYDNRWSKTMIGYGPEEDNFILELTYNYTVKHYDVGNDYQGIVIESTRLYEKINSTADVIKQINEAGDLTVKDPDGYPVVLRRGDLNKVTHCRWNVQNLANSLRFWKDTLGLKEFNRSPTSVDLAFADDQAKLQLIEINEPIDHKTGWGRIAFATPKPNQLRLNQLILDSNEYEHLHHKQELGTPGKQTVTVIILQDPDKYEICFVNDEDYSVLSRPDDDANEVLEKELASDKSR